MSKVFLVTIGEKGRSVLPAALREEAHVSVGDILASRVLGDGQILLETKLAVKRRIQDAAAKASADAGTNQITATELLREVRDEDSSLV